MSDPAAPTIPGAAAVEPPRTEVLVSAKGVVKYFPIMGGILRHKVGDVKAVDGVSFDIHKGEIFGLVGESGCGKTTLGRTVLYLQRPTAGSVEVGGQDLSTLKAGRAAPHEAPDAADLPGSIRIAEPAHAGQRHHRRRPARPGHEVPRGAHEEGGGQPRGGRAAARLHAALSRTNSQAASASASASPARWPSIRSSSSATKLSLPSTSRSSRRYSTCCSTFDANSTSPTCSSPTTCPSSST